MRAHADFSSFVPIPKSIFLRFAGFIGAVSIILATFLIFGDFKGGPVYQDRTAAEWFADPYVTNSARAFKAMGPDGIRFLAQKLPMPVNEKIGRTIFSHNPPDWLADIIVKSLNLNDEMDNERFHAADILCGIGADASPALPELLNIFRTASRSDPAIDYVDAVLESMGDKVAFLVPELKSGLKSTNADFQAICARVLGSIGPKAMPALSLLLKATNSSGLVSESAAFAAWDIDRQTNVVIDVLANLLKCNRRIFQSMALVDLEKRGIALKAVAPVVQKALCTIPENIRAETVLRELDPELLQATIARLNCDAPLILQKSIALLEAENMRQSDGVFTVIEFMGPKAESAVPILVAGLNRKAHGPFVSGYFPQDMYLANYRENVLAAIAAIGPGARDCVPALTALLGSNTWDTVGICNALAAIGSESSNAIPALQSLFTNKNAPSCFFQRRYNSYDHNKRDSVHFAAARALVEIAPDQANNAVNYLRTTDYDPGHHELVKSSVRVALWKAGLEKNPFVEDLTNMLSRPFQSRRFGEGADPMDVIKLLAEIGPPARPAIPFLTKLLLKPDGSIQPDVACAIERIDPKEADRLGLPGLLLVY